MYCQSRKRIWAKRLVLLCFGISLGVFGAKAYAGEWGKAVGWLVAAIYAVGWRIEMWNADENRLDGAFWRRLWLNHEMDKPGSDGFGDFEPPVLDNRTSDYFGKDVER